MTPERPAPLTRRPERELRNAILTLLRAHGVAAWPTGVGAFRAADRFIRMGTKGMSDIIGIVSWCRSDNIPTGGRTHGDEIGRFLAIEVKNPKGRVSPEQTAFLQTVVRAGGIGFVAHSVDEVADKLGLRK